MSDGEPVEIRRFVGAEAGEAELRQWHELYIVERKRDFPGFPLQPFPHFAAVWRDPRFMDLGPRHAWGAYAGDELLGFGSVVYPDRQLLDWAIVRVVVGAAHRSRGIGIALLREIVADARSRGRLTFVNDQVRLGSVGDRWAREMGFANVLSNRWQMLHVLDVDPALWDVPVPAGFRFEQWSDAAPDDLVAEFARARNAIGDAPTGGSSYEHREWTVERVRRNEADVRETGDEMRHVVAVHEETGALAALTGMLLRPGRVDLCWQQDTAVVERFRGHGLGRAVKAAMMRWLLAEFPDLERVVTNNAADNAHMLRVNEQVGYVYYADIGMFEASVEQVGTALRMSAAIPGPRAASESEDELV
ncbi:GNAT family N-acetyltransferase [Actinospica sp.]|uniref:GNAT family N-acetyltransferase n=1 Tax=Actinospica sp. TaxID=1872142 RepID=UPI002CCCE607|nr:GNAT family N-acetyltransferase [Actinospica sp.]HWG24613.1 GNAT family N-acetyltransferase [Actinospica sp.]